MGRGALAVMGMVARCVALPTPLSSYTKIQGQSVSASKDSVNQLSHFCSSRASILNWRLNLKHSAPCRKAAPRCGAMR